MPECAEVKIMADCLSSMLTNEVLVRVTPLSGRYTKKDIPGLVSLKLPVEIVSINVKGKFLYWQLATGQFIACTMGMTGTWCSDGSDHKAKRVAFDLDDGRQVCFCDLRNYGTVRVLNEHQLNAKLRDLGPSILHEEVTQAQFEEIIRVDRRTLAEILMDQSFLSGIGNYLKAEILYAAQLSPWRTGWDLDRGDMARLRHEIYSIARLAYRHRGATLRDFKHVDGTDGEFQGLIKVYRRKTDPSNRLVKSEETKDGRTTHWVPGYQL